MTNLIGFIKAVGPAVGIIAAVVLLVVLGAVIRKRWVERSWRKRFVKFFQIEPEDTYTARSFQQPKVDRTLISLARQFHALVDKENVLVDAYAGATPTRVSGEHDLMEYKKNREGLLAAKIAFWTAHEAASRMYFHVEKKYTDYLK